MMKKQEPCVEAELPSTPLSPGSDTLQDTPTAKLKALLRSGRYRPPENLDNHSGDFRLFVPLEGVETADMRHRRESLQDPGHGTQLETPSAGRTDPGPPATPPARQAGQTSHALALSICADRCPHRHARLQGCRRCIDACPSGAVSPGEEIPRLDLSKCLECGACAAACPSGALQLSFSPGQELLQRLKSAMLLHTDAEPPVVVCHDLRTEFPESWPDCAKPVVRLSVGSLGLVGMESLLSAMALGAAGVFLLVQDPLDECVRRRLAEEVQWSLAVLAALGFPRDCIRLVGSAEASTALEDAPQARAVPPASYAFGQPKRDLVRLAVEHLGAYSPNLPATLPLPSGAPFGSVHLDGASCTLCMACAGACKMKALVPIAGEAAGLQFAEARCIQCSLCVAVCPEDALTLVPRLNLAPGAAAFKALHQEEPARCLSCGRPFASHQMIAAIRRKLRGHWMYQDSQAQARLHMCDRCRVQDIFLSSNKGE